MPVPILKNANKYAHTCTFPPAASLQYRGACPASRSDSELLELVKKMGGDEAKIQSALEDWWQSERERESVLNVARWGIY